MRPLVAVVVASLAILAPQAALASAPTLQPGVHIDPGSPAGKQYQIPIVGARSETAGGGSTGSANPPLFGAGLTPASTSTATSTTSSSTSSSTHKASSASARSHAARARHRHSGSGASLVASSSPADSPYSPVVSPASTGGAGTNGWIALVAGGVLVLALGGGGGLALRRRLGHD
jgi:hypothetical protein